MAPGDRRAQGPLALRCVAGAVRQQLEPVLEPPSIACGVSTLQRAAASSIASGSPSRRRQISTTARGIVVGQGEVRFDRPGALDEQRHRREVAEGLDVRRDARVRSAQDRGAPAAATGNSCSPRRRSATRLVTSDREPRARSPEARRQGRGINDLLEVVEHEQSPASPGGRSSGAPPAVAPRHQRRRAPAGSWSQPAAVGDRRQTDEDDAVGPIVDQLVATASASRVLPMPGGPVRVNRRTSLWRSWLHERRYLLVAPDQRRDRRRQGRSDRLQRARGSS